MINYKLLFQTRGFFFFLYFEIFQFLQLYCANSKYHSKYMKDPEVPTTSQDIHNRDASCWLDGQASNVVAKHFSSWVILSVLQVNSIGSVLLVLLPTPMSFTFWVEKWEFCQKKTYLQSFCFFYQVPFIFPMGSSTGHLGSYCKVRPHFCVSVCETTEFSIVRPPHKWPW